MKYRNIIEGTFLQRPNRFIAHVEIEGRDEVVHVKNTGRCKELLVPGCRVYLSVSDNPMRKTKYDLVAVEKKREDGTFVMINMDSQIVNDVAGEWLPISGLFSPCAVLRREVTYGNSRFDFYIEDGERKVFLEVKGCTLEREGIGYFPDAPTERGVKHLAELTAAVTKGYHCAVAFVIQMPAVKRVLPNDKTHPEFATALAKARAAGVEVWFMTCTITPATLEIGGCMKEDK